MPSLNIGSLFGDADLENLLDRINTFSGSLALQKSESNITNDDSSAALHQFLDTVEDTEDTNSVEQLLQKMTMPAERTARYKVYDELYSMVQIIKRVIRVYINNTLQKDVITNECIHYVETDQCKADSENAELFKKYSKAISERFELEKKLEHTISHDILRYGDHYIEIVDLQNDIVDLPGPMNSEKNTNMNPGTVVLESREISESLETVEHLIKRQSRMQDPNNIDNIFNDFANTFVNTFVEFDTGVSQYDVDIPYIEESIFQHRIDEPDTPDKIGIEHFDPKSLSRFILRFHNAKNIVILNTKYNNSILGYLSIEDNKLPDVYPGVGMQFASIIKQMSNLGASGRKENQHQIIQKIVYQIISRIATNAKVKKLKESEITPKNKKKAQLDYEQQLQAAVGDELFYIIKKMFIEVSPTNNQASPLTRLKMRFIPRERMVPFILNPVEYAPHGTSVIDSLIYPGKLYLLTQLTNVVTKLSRAAIFRKWTIETGARDQHTNLIQKLKRELRNQRISVDELVSMKSIPKILSDFKDLVLLSKKGQRFVDVDIQSLGDPNVKIQDLEDQRRELIALSGVPSPYLGYSDTVDLREQLVHVNVTFATEIVGVQNVINQGLVDLNNKIALLLNINETPGDYIRPGLKPPIVLLLQMLESVMASVSNIQQSLGAANIEFNPYYLFKRFVTSIDWDEFKKEANDYKNKQAATSTGNEQQQPGGY